MFHTTSEVEYELLWEYVSAVAKSYLKPGTVPQELLYENNTYI